MNPIVSVPNFLKQSFNEQVKMVLQKLNESEFQQRKARNKEANNNNQMTAEELAAEQQAMFAKARSMEVEV